MRVNRLNEAEVFCARQQRLKEIHLWSIIHEIVIYLCFFTLLSLVTYSTRDSNSFLQVDHLRKYFLQSDYTKVCSFLSTLSYL